MTRLILRELAAQTQVWLGVFVVTTATGFIGALAAGLIETGVAYGGRILEGLSSTSSAVVMFTALAAFVVLGSTTNLTVALQRRSHALWQLVGVRPAVVAWVVLAQLGIVGGCGAVSGYLVAVPAFPPLFDWTFQEWTELQGVEVHLGLISAIAVVASTVVVVLCAGLRGARRASRTPPIEALREPEPHRVELGWFRIVLTVVLLSGTVGLVATLDASGSLSTFSAQALLVTPLVAAVFAAAGPLVYPLVLRAWTALLPPAASASWFLARHSARHRLTGSTAAIGPLMVAIALTGGLYTTVATLAVAQAERTGSGGGFDLAAQDVVLVLGGPLLLSAVAAAATVFMSGHAREREFALIQAAGSTHADIMLTAIWEAVIYAITATVLGALATAVGGTVMAVKLALPFPVVPPASLGLVAGVGLVLLLVATVVATAGGLRHDIPRTLAAE